jgi:hypothetical protein
LRRQLERLELWLQRRVQELRCSQWRQRGPVQHQQPWEQQQRQGPVQSGPEPSRLPTTQAPESRAMNDPRSQFVGVNARSGITQQHRESLERSKGFEDDDEWIPNIEI